jgi:hypothetical protein
MDHAGAMDSPTPTDRTASAPLSPKLRGKVITIPAIELPTDVDVLFKVVDEEGRLLTDLERTVLRASLDHYAIDASGPVWVLRPPDFEDCFRFIERPDLNLAS